MPGRRELLRTACCGVGVLVAGCLDGSGEGDAETTTASTATDVPTTGATATTPGDDEGFALSSPAFEDGGTVPKEYTFDGRDVSPPLSIAGVPESAASLALVVDDPDAPNPPFTHWLLWNVPPSTTTIPADVPQSESVDALDGATQGTNSFGELGYRGPRPPAGDGPHTYRFTLHAVESPLQIQAGAEREAVDAALEDTVLATARLSAEYQR